MIRKTLSALLLALAFFTGGILGPAAVQALTAPEQDAGPHLRIAGCVIRLYSTGPAIHENAAHACVGVTRVGMNSTGDLVIYRDTVQPIISCTAAIDESLAARRILAGCSGGRDMSTVKLYRSDTGKHVSAKSPLVASAMSNLWMTWIEWVN